MRARRTAGMALVLAIVAGVPRVALAHASGTSQCQAAKVKAAGQKAFARAKCEASGILSGGAADARCLDRAESRFAAAIVRADALGDCSGSVADLGTTIDGFTTGLVQRMGPVCCSYYDPIRNVGPLCGWAPDSATCSQSIYQTPGGLQSLCESDGSCRSLPPVEGRCCEIDRGQGPSCYGGMQAADCTVGTFSTNSVCAVSGHCVP